MRRISISDQFLWDLYNALEKMGDVAYLIARPKHTFRDINKDPDSLFYRKYFVKFSRQQFAKLIYRLKSTGYITVKSLKGNKAIMITKKGMSKAFMASFAHESEKKRKDGMWIMIIFDIPQKNPKARLLLRSVLKNMGYKMFQQSVWVTPYDISEQTERLLQYYNLEKYVKLFLIEAFS